MAYAMIVSAAAAPVASPIIRDNVQPLLRQGLTFVRTCLGEPDKLTFNLTHIILTALILVIIIYLDAIRAAVAANRR